jgi:hypothetical protein
MSQAVGAHCTLAIFYSTDSQPTTPNLHQQLLDVDQNNPAFPGIVLFGIVAGG